MDPRSLFASAAINIGLALIIISLFSVLRKQPSNAPIYYARRLAKRHRLHFDHSLTPSRFSPSLSWIPRAFHVTEDEILHTGGLDALVLIRLFKFGIKYFSICSLIGVTVLVPVNYYCQEEPSKIRHSMDLFSISNVKRGSHGLWVHFTCLWVISLYGLYLLYKEYSIILLKRMQQLQNIRHRPDQFTLLVRQIPLCSEHNAFGCSAEHFFSKIYPSSYQSYQVLYHGNDLEVLWDRAKHISRKIKELRGISMVGKPNKDSLTLDAPRKDVVEISIHEQKFQALLSKISHLQNEEMLKKKELPVAFVLFNSRHGAALAAQSQQHVNPLLWTTEMAPEPRDVSWRNLAISFRVLLLYRTGVIVAASLLTLFFAIPVTAVQGIAKFEKLKQWFPPAIAIELIPGLSSIVTGYLPSAILNGFIYIVPYAMLALTKVSGCVSRSKEEIKACNMVFYFLVGNVFFLSLISGSLLEEIGESFAHPKDIPRHLASAVSAQADFFVTYILTNGLAGFSLEILQPGLLLWAGVKSCINIHETEENPYLFSLPYFRVIPFASLSILIGMVYAIVSPLLLPFLMGYFCLGYIVYVNQIEDVYETTYETCGQYWPYIHRYTCFGIILMQITMIGLFGLKSKPAASVATVPLLLFTIVFNEYCRINFHPSFRHYPIKNAVENDELDEKGGRMEVNRENAKNSYLPPFVRPINFVASESSLIQPLLLTV